MGWPARWPAQRIEGRCVTSAAPGGYVPVRLDAPSLLGAPSGRREAHHLSALSVGVALAEDVDWRTNILEGFRSVAWAGEHHMAWRRLRRALDHLAGSGVARAELRPFQPGTATLTAREEPTSLLHDRARTEERSPPLARGALRSVTAEHGLSWVGTGLLLLLLLLCDHRSGELPEGCWTKTSLCERFGVGWRRLSAGLDALAAAGLIAFTVRRGGTMSLTLLARAALVAPTAPAQPRRRERRATRREAERGSGPAGEVAAKLVGHHGLGASPSPALLAALADALNAGISAPALLERLAARGSLAGAADPMAVLVTRARQVKDEILAARDETERRRAAEAAERQRRAEAKADEERRREGAAGEDRWLASVLDRVPSGAELGLAAVIAARPLPVAAHIHAALADLIAHFPDLDPAGLAARWADRPCAPEALDITGIASRHEDTHGPPGSLPQARAGPSLAERLRNQNA